MCGNTHVLRWYYQREKLCKPLRREVRQSESQLVAVFGEASILKEAEVGSVDIAQDVDGVALYPTASGTHHLISARLSNHVGLAV